MSILTKLFGQSGEVSRQPDMRFGRFSDSYKTPEQYEAWDRAITYFEDGKYMESYLNFFEYLKNPEEDNVKLNRKGNLLRFELCQGSLLIKGFIDGKRIRVKAALAEAEQRPLSLMKELMSLNYDLKYSRYALDDDGNLCIIFDSFLIDSSPYKLYYGLKELAIQADKLDDLLLKKFPFLQAVERDHIQSLPERERQIKYRYLCDELDRLFYKLEEGPLEVARHPNSGMYLILDTCYRLDCLLLPEGPTREAFERIHGLFAAQDGVHPSEKVKRAKESLQTIRNASESAIKKEFYNVSSTFGRITPVDSDWVAMFVSGERPNMDWYLENELEEYALAVSGYIIGYQMFNVAVPAPIRALYSMYYQLTEESFFDNLGYQVKAHTAGDRLDQRRIRKKLKSIEDTFDEVYDEGDLTGGELDISSDGRFARSLLDLVCETASRQSSVIYGNG